MNRRRFLQAAGLVPALTLLPLGRDSWAARTSDGESNPKRLVVVFLRGAVDGLNVVIPHAESVYYDTRPNIAIPRRGDDALINLDGRFGLHPALASLYPLWQEQRLAFVHACGSPDSTRSHFDAQDYMESGTPGKKTTSDGWMNRLLAQLPGAQASTRAVNFGPTLPRILDGKLPTATIAAGKEATKPMVLDRPEVSSAFDRLYQGQDALSVAYRQGQTARKQLLAALQEDMEMADNHAPSALGFVGMAEQAARVLTREPNVRLAFLAVGGWDTHINQGASTGQLAKHLKPLGEGLATLVRQLGREIDNTTIVVFSEFGRTVRENGNGGTDHGHGNVMWLLGAKVRGGKIHGRWPGLAEEQLYEGRDLAITTDFREPLGIILSQHLRLTPAQLAAVFPQFRFAPEKLPGLLG